MMDYYLNIFLQLEIYYTFKLEQAGLIYFVKAS